MIPSAHYDDGFCRMFVGDAIAALSQLPEKSVHCCVTSPPYFGLRSYLAADHPEKAKEGGTQETPEQYVAWLVEVFRGAWRVLRDDGTCWLNLGDSYASGGGIEHAHRNSGKHGLLSSDGERNQAYATAGGGHKRPNTLVSGLKPKDLLMIPARVALALQADGWYLRSQIVWTKPNPMPESVTDRPTQATEMVYLLTKKPRYFYDAEAVKEAHARLWNPATNGGSLSGNSDRNKRAGRNDGARTSLPEPNPSGRNLRNCWQISTRPYPGSHYATFPPELPLRCIKAGTSEHGVCSECGAPWRRVVERTGESARYIGQGNHSAEMKRLGRNHLARAGDFQGKVESRTIGFEPTCSHSAGVEPATVLDPFSGSGTTGLVARKLGRRSILIDIDDRNVRLLEQRMGYQGVLL